MNSDSFRTITVLPINTGIPVNEFGSKLLNAFLNIGRNAVAIDQVTILSHLGRHAFTKMGKLKLAGYLADLEERHQTVIFIADTSVNSLWTQRCISQADCILLVSDALSSPDIGDYERLVIGMNTTARTELVLVHSERYIQPGLTKLWLKNRVWVHSHHHIQMQLHSFNDEDNAKLSPISTVLSDRLALIKSKVQKLQSGLMSRYKLRRGIIYTAHNKSYKNDFNRLARILSGQAVGLVLGGGGARGIAHIGVIKALEDFGIPIDIVGGTSIGSFVGGLYARDYDLVQIYGRAKRFSGRMASIWRMICDLTYPATSYTTGHEFNRGIWKSFGDSRIEDFWLKYYNNTTNITHSRMEVHTSGYAWRYIRASMSLAGLLPPMVDNDGSMLLDGGYMDNLTVEEMKSQGASVIISVDVGSIDETTPMSYGDSLSGLWVLFNRWNFFSRQPNIPSLAEIQARLAYVSSVGALNRAKDSPGVMYLRPPIDDYATLDFGKFDEIYTVGAQYGSSILQALVKTGELQIPGANITKTGHRIKTVTRRNSI
ncbi:patatin-domain-containing protein [Nadsonia fulvescens var. elongata DSM 6958]|uniref:Lysophospholipase NTE1 n=1 Tax=Nadsonia fulvescens var. elongata DSM 6958 TaxID=857566 RepID=A0A1E3PLI8_9ASCO|nr:patatin-domain-containing protein [Nadsonia fulvescens var. elongata DSM 6958]